MGSDEPPLKVSLGKAIMTEAQQREFNGMLNRFDEVVTKSYVKLNSIRFHFAGGKITMSLSIYSYSIFQVPSNTA